MMLSQVLFPMLARLLEVGNTEDPMGVEETRMRAATLLCKVFDSLAGSLSSPLPVWGFGLVARIAFSGFKPNVNLSYAWKMDNF